VGVGAAAKLLAGHAGGSYLGRVCMPS